MIEQKVKAKRGGARKGAGRPKGRFRRDAPHRARPALSSRYPVHVVLRLWPGFEMRTRKMYSVIRTVMTRYYGLPDFRICHFSIQQEHLHLIVEANDRDALTRNMQSFTINCARAINEAEGRKGKVFQYRYHATQIRTPRQAHNEITYVLNNWRKHRQDYANKLASTYAVDPYSSGPTFTGWSRRIDDPPMPGYIPLPVSPPMTSLLRVEYKSFGGIDPWHTPGPKWR